MYVGLQVKYPSFLLYFDETWILSKIFQEYSNTEFHKNPYSGSRVVPRTDGQAEGRIEMIKPIVALRNFADVLKMNNTPNY